MPSETNSSTGLADFIRHRILVSDIVSYTCGSAPCSAVSEDGKHIFCFYQASHTGKGECHDIVVLADIPLDNPAAAQSYLIAEKETSVAGVYIEDVIHTSAFMWKGKARVILSLNDAILAWREWDPVTKQVTGEGIIKCVCNGRIQAMTPEAMNIYLNSQNCQDFNIYRERHDRILASAKLRPADGALCGYLTSSSSQPILYSSTDGETFQFDGFVPAVCQYECQIAFLDGAIFAIGRGMKGDNFFVSHDNGATFVPGGRVPDGLCRQQLLVHRGKLLIGYPAPDELPSIVRNGRNNFHLLAGKGDTLAGYTEILHAFDPMGLIMFELIAADNDLYVLWSNAERFPDYIKWGAVQGKDQVLIGKVNLDY